MDSPGYSYHEIDEGGKHLYIVLTRPCLDYPKMVLVVNISKNKPYKDQTCILLPGCHRAITIPSVVMYDRYIIAKLRELKARESEGLCQSDLRFEGDLLTRIIAGVLASPRTPEECKTFLRLAVG